MSLDENGSGGVGRFVIFVNLIFIFIAFCFPDKIGKVENRMTCGEKSQCSGILGAE